MGKADEARRRSEYPQVQGASPMPPMDDGAAGVMRRYQAEEDQLRREWYSRAKKQGLQQWEIDLSIETAMKNGQVPKGYEDLAQRMRQARILRTQAERAGRGY